MKWVTRERPKVDRIACPWLIRRFIDPDAQIVYVPAEQVISVAEADNGYSFDTKGATYSHRKQADGSEWCTFETLIHEHHLDGDPALMELARIVHAADISTDTDSHPFGAALRAIGDAGSAVENNDQTLLERALFVYDALYANAQRHTRRASDTDCRGDRRAHESHTLKPDRGWAGPTRGEDGVRRGGGGLR
ncbi:MAG TPA: chromate resistance protein ChrB domain-containing protein [Candidatus Limnocylindrales bacterium]|nr:chromate resistance protein ChrB domain-containing protein [Candidatus Limnocylindrales bacterium]